MTQEKKKKGPSFTSKVMASALEELDRKYLDERAKECERLHERLVNVLVEEAASPQNTAYVLQLLLFETMADQYRRVFEEMPLSEAKPQPLQHEAKRTE